MYNKIKTIHLIGIGGIGMSGIAELCRLHGHSVQGSDRSRNETVRRLEALGIRIFEGHEASHVEGAELVVFSSAIKPDNPEMAEALRRQIPTIPRAEMLAELMRLKYGIAIAGAHGKTTTTSMIAHILVEAGLDPTIVVGGRMDNFGGTNARLGRGEFMVAEADESDGSFNKLSPSIAVVTNLDREHIDFYKSMSRVKKAFLTFMDKVPFYGASIACADDLYLKMLLPRVTRRKITYGFSPGATYHLTQYDYDAHCSKASFEVKGKKESLELQVPGKHNVLNALAAIAVADELCVPRPVSLRSLAAFQGVQRRFQRKGELRGVLFIDDYAHHPAEIAATLAAARERYPQAKLRVVFQPHRYTRVEDLFDRFSTCFRECDAVAVTQVYAAGEQPIPGVEAPLLAESIRRHGKTEARYFDRPIDAVGAWLEQSQAGDVILTLGAGDLPNVYRDLF